MSAQNRIIGKTDSSRNWCQGFCRTCGTGCAEYEERIAELMAQLQALIGSVESNLSKIAENGKNKDQD